MKKKKLKKLKSKIGQKEVLKYFWKVTMTKKWLFFLIVFLTIVASATALLLPLYFSKIIDIISTFSSGDKAPFVAELFWILWIILILEVSRVAAWRIFWFSLVKLEIDNQKKIFLESFNHLHRHSYKFFTNNFGWSLVKKVNKLAYSYENIVDIFLLNLLRLTILLPAIIVTIFIRNQTLWFIFLGFTLFYGISQYLMYKWNIKNQIAANEEDSIVTWVLADTITNNFNILTFSSLNREMNYFGKILKWWTKKQFKARNRSEVINMIWWVFIVSFELCLIYFAITLWGQDLITTWTIVLAQLYTLRMIDQMWNLWNVFKRWNRTIWESAEMLEIMYMQHEIQDDKISEDIKVKDWKIEFKDVSFAYNKSNSIFSWLNFRIKPGERVAFVWESWAGKTSIVKLIMRFFDIQKGKILIDWQDVSKVTQESLRDSISIVPQDPILFHRTLKENIAYGKSDASDAEIFAASKMARCHDFVMNLEKWYDTLVWERWIKLSGWERQRVAIARAILENKSILLLDEATSALDSESELLIQEAMQEVMKWKTVLIVAHRLSTIMNVDKIIVMDDGEVVEQWSHKELLLKRDGIYKKFREIQSGGFKG